MNKRNLTGGIWLIGLGILFLLNMIWPGILILIGITILIGAIMPNETSPVPPPAAIPPVQPPAANVEQTPSLEEIKPLEPAREEPLPPSLAAVADLMYLKNRLPETCPFCGGPVKANFEKITNPEPDAIQCPFCASRIILS